MRQRPNQQAVAGKLVGDIVGRKTAFRLREPELGSVRREIRELDVAQIVAA